MISLFRCMVSEYRYRKSVKMPTLDLHRELALLVNRYKPSGGSPELREAELLVIANSSYITEPIDSI